MSAGSAGGAAGRVVSLNSLGRERSPGVRILGECRDRLVAALAAWLNGIATPISEEFLKLADSTRDRQEQARYIALRGEIEKNWPHLVDAFRRQCTAGADRCIDRHGGAPEKKALPLEVPNFEGLKLLDDDDLSEHIVLREFSVQLTETCEDELYTLNRRVAVLLALDEPDEKANPLAPPIVCEALSEACANVGKDGDTRLLLMRRLERHLHDGLPPAYEQINAYLIERGILPELRRNFRKNPNLDETSSTGYRYQGPASTYWAGGGGGMGGGPANVGGGGGPALNSEAILEALQRLAQARPMMPPGAVMVPGGMALPGTGVAAGPGMVVGAPALTPLMPGVMVPAGEAPGGLVPQAGMPGPGLVLDSAGINQFLLAALSQPAPAVSSAVPAEETGAAPAIVNQVRRVRESESAQQVGGLAGVTIDIVAMLFDFILDDAHIPPAIKALISRLQIPVLKVAMLNPGFFADRQHPTRRFLGNISGISIRWGDSVDENDPFYLKLAELIDRIQAGFEDDIEIFGTALAELEAFVAEHEREEESTALVAANVVIQREQQAASWERAQEAVLAFRRDHVLPAVIDTLIGEHWAGVLQATAGPGGEPGEAWHAALGTLKDLAWSIEVKKTAEDRRKLVGLLPSLLGRLNAGLDQVAVGAEARKALLDELVKLHSAALKGEAPAEAPPPAVSAAAAPAPTAPTDSTEAANGEGDLLVMRSVDNGVEVEEVMLVGAGPLRDADESEILRRVNHLRRGDWVEFRDDEGMANRVRLHWISPQKGILLFSNHRSAKAISIAPEALARQIRDGKADFVQEQQLFESALSGALQTLSDGVA